MQRGAYHDDHIDIIHNCSTMKEAGMRGKEIAEGLELFLFGCIASFYKNVKIEILL